MRFLLILLILAFSFPCQAEPPAAEKLLKVVALSRHGVRAPTQKQTVLASWSQKVWPDWPVKHGDLTPRGGRLVTAMWVNMGSYIAKTGLLPENSCPAQKDILVRADVDERTRATAAAILASFGKNCQLGYRVLQHVEVDPLFHPVKAGLYHFNPVTAATNILANSAGGLDYLQDEFNNTINLIGSITGQPAPQLCRRFTMASDCNLSDLPNAISVSPEGTDIRLAGSLDIASSVAEIFLLEFAQWPRQDAGWGQVNGKILEQIMPVHAKIFDIVNRAPLVAWAKGSALLSEISKALQENSTESAYNEAKIVIFVGHDTNIANIGGLLNLNWQAVSYPENGIPPAGVLFFELWDINGKKQVRVKFFAQPIETLHKSFDDFPVTAYAPKSVPVTAAPVVGEARFTLEEFSKRVKDTTEGAPIPDTVLPPLDYNKTFNRLK